MRQNSFAVRSNEAHREMEAGHVCGKLVLINGD